MVIGGRNLTLRFSLAPEYLHSQRSWLAWSVLAIGLLFTALLGAFLLVAAGRTALIEETVVRRTSQLRRSHAELEQTRIGLAENEHRLQEAQRIAHVGSWEWDVAGRKVSWSDELYRIHGARPGAFIPGYRTYLRLTHPDDRAALGTAVRQALGAQEAFPLEHRIIRPDGSTRMIQSNGRIVADSDGRIVRLLGTAQDVTEFKEIEQRLLQLAHFDPLTSLPNRTLFYQSLGLSLAQAADQGWVISVLLLDIDHFKNANDTMGHASGDELLRQLGQRLVRTLRVRDTVGRLGGDEFAIILINPDSTHDSAPW